MPYDEIYYQRLEDEMENIEEVITKVVKGVNEPNTN